jgi:hypothetical protein
MSSTKTIYARVFAPDPQHEAAGKYVRGMIYEGCSWRLLLFQQLRRTLTMTGLFSPQLGQHL